MTTPSSTTAGTPGIPMMKWWEILSVAIIGCCVGIRSHDTLFGCFMGLLLSIYWRQGYIDGYLDARIAAKEADHGR
jgi:hypothetical protein